MRLNQKSVIIGVCTLKRITFKRIISSKIFKPSVPSDFKPGKIPNNRANKRTVELNKIINDACVNSDKLLLKPNTYLHTFTDNKKL